MKENRVQADLFAAWYIENKTYLRNALGRSYAFHEDILSDIFFSVYCRILHEGIRIKDFTPYMIKAYRYRYLSTKKKASRLVLLGDLNLLQNICYAENL